MSDLYLSIQEYLRFCVQWSKQYHQVFQTYHDKPSFQKRLPSQRDHLTLLDILKLWYGPQKEYYVFHTTNSSLWWVLRQELEKPDAKDLRGDGLLGKGFYLTPNPRLAFLYGARGSTLFRDKFCFLVFCCRISSVNAATLIYEQDFSFHDKRTLRSLDKPVNSNRLQHIEINLKTPSATAALHLSHVFHVAGGKEVLDDRWFVHETIATIQGSSVFMPSSTPYPLSRGLLPNLLNDVIFECVEGVGTIFHIQKYVRFVIFEGTIQSFLRKWRHDAAFLKRFRSLLVSLGVDIRIHFNRFSRDNWTTSPAKCFLLEGYTTPLNPCGFFSNQSRRNYKRPLSFLSTSTGRFRPVLVVPPHDETRDFSNIYQFARAAPDTLFADFFTYSSRIAEALLGGSVSWASIPNASARDTERIEKYTNGKTQWYMNVHGGSVGWLHLRFDNKPAYYSLEEYEVLESPVPAGFHCERRLKKLLQAQGLKKLQEQGKNKRLRTLLDGLVRKN